MKKLFLIVTLNFAVSAVLFSQTKTYFTSGGEMIFSFANIDQEGNDPENLMRWSPVINMQGMFNADFNENIGIFTGLAIRNVGYIYNNYKIMENDQEISVKKKFRTYNLGLPLGIKIGNLNKAFFYGGYEIEFPFHYKEKTFRDEQKDKFSVWFSNRVEQFQHGFIVGVQLPRGANIKFKYYMSGFHNTDYTESTGNKPYANLNTNIFYISLNFMLFKNGEFYDSNESSKEYF